MKPTIEDWAAVANDVRRALRWPPFEGEPRIPTDAELAELDEALPGAAERLRDMARVRAEHRLQMERLWAGELIEAGLRGELYNARWSLVLAWRWIRGVASRRGGLRWGGRPKPRKQEDRRRRDHRSGGTTVGDDDEIYNIIGFIRVRPDAHDATRAALAAYAEATGLDPGLDGYVAYDRETGEIRFTAGRERIPEADLDEIGEALRILVDHVVEPAVLDVDAANGFSMLYVGPEDQAVEAQLRHAADVSRSLDLYVGGWRGAFATRDAMLAFTNVVRRAANLPETETLE